MVKTSSPMPSMNWEPIELRLLKRQLTDLTCKCALCERNKSFKNYHMQAKTDKEVQVSQCIRSSDKCNQISPYLLSNNMINPFGSDGFCANCLLTMNLLARRETKTLKDVETETNKRVHCDTCDKYVTKYIKSAMRYTTTPNSLPQEYSNITMSDFLSQCSSDAMVPCKQPKRSDNENMKLIGYGTHIDAQMRSNHMRGNCLYLEDYVDSIRPPLE